MIGQTIGGYKVVSKLGEGGMGVVYLGEHQRIARRAAIKVLRPDLSDNAEVVARFFTEARATSMIRHPGIVEILDCDTLPDGNAFIVMEYLEGETVSAALARESRFAPPRALALVRNVADALAAAHERGIVHRDLKPDNLFLPTATGGAGTVPIKILDFGIAKLTMLDAGGHHKTRTGRLLGTPTYMSPEQCRGARDIDLRTDVYSLGCILFEMLCGRPPFDAQGFGELIYGHLSSPPPSPRALEPLVSPGLEKLVLRMLAKEAEHRPENLRAVVAEIDRISGAPASAGVVTEAYRAGGSGAPPPARRMSPAKGRTTLGAAASESMPIADGESFADERPARRRSPLTGPLVAIASAAVVVAGVISWRHVGPRPSVEPTAAAVAPPAVTAPAPPAPPAPAAPEPAAHAPVEPPPAPAAPSAPTKSAPASRSVIVSISSKPSGADVCLVATRTRLGKTQLDWKTERSARETRLLVRKEGYRGEEIAVMPERDVRRRVILRKLGSDDLEDTESCP